MTEDTIDNSLLSNLHRHNPWWKNGVSAFDELDIPAQKKSDFYGFASPHKSEPAPDEVDVYALVGQRGVGKTVLISQFIRQRVKEDGIPPQNVLYIPFDENPLYQLQSNDQLRRAVNYYEGRILSQVFENDAPQYIILDDVHRIEHPNKSLEGWGKEVKSLINEAEDRHVIVTASAELQIERELKRVGFDSDRYSVWPIFPEKFSDHIQSVFPELGEDERRLSPRPIRKGETGLPNACRTGDPTQFFETLRELYDSVEADSSRIRSQVAHYLALGGVLSYEAEGIDSASNLSEDTYKRRREDVRLSLYQEIPGLDAVKNIADLERLCALVAADLESPFRYNRLSDLFDVDRRTLRESYFEALDKLFLLTPSPEYDNSRPRSIRLYLRDTALVNSYLGHTPSEVLNDYQLESKLARAMAFDHSMRFSFNMNRYAGYDFDDYDPPAEPTVEYWPGTEGEVDFVFECAGVPVPIGLGYKAGSMEPTTNAVAEFIETYEAPLGIVVAGDTATLPEPVEVLEATPIVRIPYWFYLMLA
jgi:predicted AAA+ superfamily ATPase